jgi:dTDP-4-amino-4,6-dideoxygalactose transaminase
MEIAYQFAYPVPPATMQAVQDVLHRRIHYFGPYTDALEAKLAALCGVPRAVCASSGSACLLLALHACGVRAGEDVVMPANVYAGVPEATILLGANPILVDVEAETANIDVDLVAAAVTPRTRSLVVQHTYGHAADMDPLRGLARARELRIIEDGAHALGGRYKGRPVGGLGDVGVFAFSNKGVSACGVGGAATAGDGALADEMQLRRYHGRRGTYETLAPGYNFRLTEMVAAVASCQLDLLGAWNERRRRNAAGYTRGLADAGVPVRTLRELPYAHHVYLHYVIRTEERDALRAYLGEHGVETRVHYPLPAHFHRGFKERMRYLPGQFPVAEALSRECLSLPCNPNIDELEIEYVVDKIKSFYARH